MRMMGVARQFGRSDWRAFLHTLSPSDLDEWEWYFERHPPVEDRIEYLLAQLNTLTANANRDPKRRREPFVLIDFTPWVEKKKAQHAASNTEPGVINTIAAMQEAYRDLHPEAMKAHINTVLTIPANTRQDDMEIIEPQEHSNIASDETVLSTAESVNYIAAWGALFNAHPRSTG